jgi:hypothetical protein
MVSGGVVCAWRGPAYAQSAGRLALLKEFVEVVGAAGDSLEKLTDAFKHLIVTGVQGFDGARARLVHAELVETSAFTTSLLAIQSTVPENLGRYAAEAPTLSAATRETVWRTLIGRMQKVLEQVRAILERVRDHRSDFVAEPAYVTLTEALQARAALLEKLVAMPPPVSEPELALVREAAARYGGLIAELKRARDQMNEYVKNLPS